MSNNIQQNTNAVLQPGNTNPDPNAPAPMVRQMAESDGFMAGAPQDATQVQPAQPAIVSPMRNVFAANGGVTGRFERVGTAPDAVPPQNGQTPMAPVSPVRLGKAQRFPDEMPGKSEPDGGTSPIDEGMYATGNAPTSEAPQFNKDETKRDGGFFGWLGGLVKKRPGRRAGETDDEYDERMTRNNERIAVLADAIRHMGNIYNTSKGAPLQKFNSPIAGFEQGLQQRKAERKAKAAAEADAAYKNTMLQMKKDAADADRTYKAMTLGYKDAAEKRAQKKMEEDADRWNKSFEYKQNKDAADMEYKKGRDKVKDSQWAATNALGWYRATHSKSGGGSGGSGGGSGSLAGKGGSLTNLSTPRGHMNRKKDLNSIEKRQLKDYLYKNGFITKEAARKYDMALSEPERGAILNGWIGWAANAKGTNADRFRKTLKDHYGYVETATVGGGNTPKSPAKAAKPSAPKGSKRSAESKVTRKDLVI